MTRFALHMKNGCPMVLPGRNAIEAIESNFRLIAEEAGIGSPAGYHLVEVTSTYNQWILGGKGGIEVTITAKGLPLAHRPGEYTPEHTGRALIYADKSDLPEPHRHSIRTA
jgi:hypothetical protein